MTPRAVFATVLGAVLAPFTPAQGHKPVVAPAETSAAAAVQMSEPVLRSGIALFEEAVERDRIKGAVLLVARRGTVVLHEAVGWRNQEAGQPMRRDSLFRLASNTKPVIATAVLMLVQQGKLALADHVRQYLRGWDNPRSEAVRIEHLLSHTSGLRIPSLFLHPLLEPSSEHPDAPDIVFEAERFGEVGPVYPPGSTYSYSNAGFNTLGAIITVVSGKPLKVYLRDAIYEPLGMADSFNHEPDAPQDRMVRVYRRSVKGWKVVWSPGDPPDVPFARASGGMIASAHDYFLFLQSILDSRTAGGPLLSRESAMSATRNHVVGLEPQAGHGSHAMYGYGWVIAADGSFSHGGSDGTWAWVDPAREIVGLVFTQSPGGEIPRRQFRRVVEAACSDEPK